MRYRINYSKVVSQADGIFDDAARLSRQAKRMLQAEEDGRNAWKGEAADVFFSRMGVLRTEMEGTAYRMELLASEIRACADRIQREDKNAEELATRLNSGK